MRTLTPSSRLADNRRLSGLAAITAASLSATGTLTTATGLGFALGIGFDKRSSNFRSSSANSSRVINAPPQPSAAPHAVMLRLPVSQLRLGQAVMRSELLSPNPSVHRHQPPSAHLRR